MDDLLGKVQRRMMCALKPQKRVILIGEQSCNEPVSCASVVTTWLPERPGLQGAMVHSRMSVINAYDRSWEGLTAGNHMASAAQSGRSWLQAPEIEQHQCDL